MSLKKEKLDDDKNFNLYDRFLCQIEILVLKMIKLLKILGFSRFITKFLKFQVFPGYFYLNCWVPGFSRFPGKVATLFLVVLKTLYINLFF